MEDPNLQLSILLEVCYTLKFNGVSTDAIQLCLFPFLLKDKALAWPHLLPLDSIITWVDLTKAFLAKLFPPSKMASLSNQITTFTQREGEFLYEAWARFKDSLTLCPHHGFQKWMIIETFYNGVTAGTLMNKAEDEAYNR